MESMVFEYNQSETEAEEGIVAEANNLRDCIGHITLEDKEKRAGNVPTNTGKGSSIV